MPGVAAATAARSTSGASGTSRVCTSRILRRPVRSGGLTVTRRSNRPGRSSAGSRISGRLVAASTTTPSVPVNPSISVRIWLSVCSRSSLPAERLRAAAGPADGVQLVDEDDRRRHLLGLVEQVAHPAGADADDRLDELRRGDREERHLGLAGHRAGQQGLAACRAGRRAARRAGSARPAGGSARGSRRKSTISVTSCSTSSMPATSANVVRGPAPAGTASPGTGRTRRARPARRRPAAAPQEPEQQPDQQQGRPEADEQLLPQRRGRVRRVGVDRDAVGLQLREQVVVGEDGRCVVNRSTWCGVLRPGRVVDRLL